MSIFEQLKAPFPVEAVSWRVGATNAKKLGVKPWEATKGIALAYIDARDVMARLDSVVGSENWQCRYPLAAGSLIICEIGINVPVLDQESGETSMQWIWKANGAGETDVEADKGKCSDAFKRAAVLWGIGQYLYDLPNTWCDLQNGRLVTPPQLPTWARPAKPEPLATKSQLAEIEKFLKNKQMPKRTLSWYEGHSSITAKQAANIINICNEHTAEKAA